MQFDSPLPYSRPLSEDFAPPRTLYVIQIPAILAVTAFVSWIIGTELAMVVGSLCRLCGCSLHAVGLVVA